MKNTIKYSDVLILINMFLHNIYRNLNQCKPILNKPIAESDVLILLEESINYLNCFLLFSDE